MNNPALRLCSRNICRDICTCRGNNAVVNSNKSTKKSSPKKSLASFFKQTRRNMMISNADDIDAKNAASPAEPERKLQPLAAYKVIPSSHTDNNGNNENDFVMVISKGSVLDFSYFELNDNTRYTEKGDGGDDSPALLTAIVNAANEGCIGGGGVDGAINAAGGEQLVNDRMALPSELPGYPPGVRCPTGKARITGPCFPSYGELHVPYVIHAVGPNYMDFANDMDFGDQLLYNAYRYSLLLAKKHNIEAIGFSLLSSGIFRYKRSLDDVLSIAVQAIQNFEGYSALKEVHLCAFNEREANTLINVSELLFSSSPPPSESSLPLQSSPHDKK